LAEDEKREQTVPEAAEEEDTGQAAPEAEDNGKETEVPVTEEAPAEGAEHTSRKERKKKAEARAEQLEKEKKALEEKNAELEDRFIRKVAEFDNYRKRTEKEKLESVSLGVSSALETVLPVFDSLALAAEAECSDETYKKGVEMTLDAFRKGLEKLEVREIDALGKPFDPKYHNAVMSEPAEGAESGTVTKVLQRGFVQGDRVIRYAMVAVAE